MQLQIILLIIVQLLILSGIFKMSVLNKNLVLFKYFNPYSWFCFFYFFWFLVPQIVAAIPPHFVIGFRSSSVSKNLSAIGVSQMNLTLYFLVPVLFSVLLFRPLKRLRSNQLKIHFKHRLTQFEWGVIGLFFIVGILSNIYLGSQLLDMEGYRAGLVKSFTGRVAFAMIFLGNFAFSFLSFYLLRRGKVYKFLMILLVFVSSILLTSARGRMLWPILLVFSSLLIYYNKFNVIRIGVIGTAFLFVLLMIDPLVMFFRTGNIQAIYKNIPIESLASNLFFRRNFDGFANFTTIAFYDNIPYDLSLLWNGARDVFLLEYFPMVLKNNFGYGATFPGVFWLSGGKFFLVMLSFFYGLSLGIMNIMTTKIRSEYLFWVYLTLMPWYCAIAGNFIESLDKMIVAVCPPLLIFFLFAIFKKRR